MNRDMHLIYLILKFAEERADGCGCAPLPEFFQEAHGMGVSESELHYHIGLCQKAGYIEARKDPVQMRIEGTCIPRLEILNLTWEGHEMLESML